MTTQPYKLPTQAIKAKLEHQATLEMLYSNNELMPRMRQVFEDYGAKDILEDMNIDVKLGMAVLVQMALRKRCQLTVLVGLVRKYMPTAQDAMNEVKKCIDAGLVEWTGQEFITKFTMPADVQQELDKFQFPLPMVVRPKYVLKNTDTGYLHSGAHGSIILQDNHTEDDVCLDHINRVNKMRFCINLDTALMVKNQWRNLDKPKIHETQLEFQKRKKAFEKYDSHAYRVIGLVCKEGNEFYLTNKYDKRGRIYAQGYYINPQGTEWNRAVIQFADEELIED